MNTKITDKPKEEYPQISFDMDFYIRECVRRRIYLDNRDNINHLEAAARTLRKCAECLSATESYQEGRDIGEYEYQLLERVLAGRIEGFCCASARSAGVTCCDSETIHLLTAACDYSFKYGYIISDMMMSVDGLPIRDVLIHKLVNENKIGMMQFNIEQSHSIIVFPNDNIRFFGPNAPHWDKVKTKHNNMEQNIGNAIVNKIENITYNFSIEDICAIDFSIDASISRISLEITSLRMAIVALDIFKLYKEIFDKLSNYYDEENELSKEFDLRHIYNHPIIFAPYCGMSTELINIYDNILKSKFEDKDLDFYSDIKKRNKTMQSSLKKLKNKAIKAKDGLYAGPYRKSIASESRILGLYIWDIVNLEGKTASDAVQLFIDKYKEFSGLEYKHIDSNSTQLYLEIIDKCIRYGVFLPIVY